MLAVVSLVTGFRRHRRFRAFWFLLPGVALMLAGLAIDFDARPSLHAVLVSVGGIDTNESADAVGIGIGAQAYDDVTVASGGISGAEITRNRVNGVVSTSATGFSAGGIVIAGTSGGAPNVVANNMVTGVTAPSTSPDLVAGIYVIGVPGSSTRNFASRPLPFSSLITR